jgi:hypothetical protein
MAMPAASCFVDSPFRNVVMSCLQAPRALLFAVQPQPHMHGPRGGANGVDGKCGAAELELHVCMCVCVCVCVCESVRCMCMYMRFPNVYRVILDSGHGAGGVPNVARAEIQPSRLATGGYGIDYES